MNYFRICALVAAYLSICTGVVVQKGYFWQVSDFHYDSNYSVYGDPTKMCHNSTGGQFHNSIFGNYLCDAPLRLVQSATNAMKQIYPNPDFILWTGDSVPHVNASTMNIGKVIENIGVVAKQLRDTFPKTTIYPVLGNHDAYPQDAYTPYGSQYYSLILLNAGFNTMLSNASSDQFIKGGGYYSDTTSTNLRIIGLNTNLYYSMDKLTENNTDPAGQFKWLRAELQQARVSNQKVIILTHVPPGMFELYDGLMWFYDDFNTEFVSILRSYSDVISAQIYGHEHTDSFRILQDKEGIPSGVLFLSPAVTPWKSTLKGVGYNNPSVRLYTYNQLTGSILNYKQYYLDLAESQKTGKDSWKLEYDATKDYGLNILDAKSMQSLADSFKDKKDDTLFKKYLSYNSVSAKENPQCDDTCRLVHYCSITELETEKYKECRKGYQTTPVPNHRTTRHHHHMVRPVKHYYIYIIAGLGALVFILFIVVAILCFRRRRHFLPHRYSRFGAAISKGPIN